MIDLTFVEITDINDDLLPAWLDLYETSFPPEEKVLVSDFLLMLKEKSRGEWEQSHMMAALDSEAKLVGILRFDALLDGDMACLWYLAVTPEARGRGMGSACLEEALRRCREAGARAALWEVEIPEKSPDPEFARRRIEFYRRHGALMLRGIHYLQSVGPHQPAIPMHMMVYPFEPVTPQQALDFVRGLFGEESVTQTGELGLE